MRAITSLFQAHVQHDGLLQNANAVDFEQWSDAMLALDHYQNELLLTGARTTQSLTHLFCFLCLHLAVAN